MVVNNLTSADRKARMIRLAVQEVKSGLPGNQFLASSLYSKCIDVVEWKTKQKRIETVVHGLACRVVGSSISRVLTCQERKVDRSRWVE